MGATCESACAVPTRVALGTRGQGSARKARSRLCPTLRNSLRGFEGIGHFAIRAVRNLGLVNTGYFAANRVHFGVGQYGEALADRPFGRCSCCCLFSERRRP